MAARDNERLVYNHIHMYIPHMAIHERILEVVLRICRERGKWTFGPSEVVAALADLNPGSVRTHVMSRCCVNAPAHHVHRWPYFRRLRRGVYEILPAWRRRDSPGGSGAARPSGRDRSVAAAGIVVEVRESASGFVAKIRGRRGEVRSTSLDELAAQVREAGRRAGETYSGTPDPLHLQIESEPERSDPVIAAYEKDIDRTLVLQSLRMGLEERLLALQGWMNDTDEIRGAVRRRRRRAAR